MYRLMKKRHGLSMVITIILCIGMIASALAIDDETRDYLLTGADISKVADLSELQPGDIVRGPVSRIYGVYAEDDAGKYYIISVGDKIMGLYLDNRYDERAKQILVDTLTPSQEDRAGRRLYTGGFIYEMNQTEKQYFHEWIVEFGLLSSDEIPLYVEDWTYEVVPLTQWRTDLSIGVYIVIIIGFVVLLFTLFWFMTGRNIAKVKKEIQKNGWNPVQVEADVLSGYRKRNIMIGKTYILYNSTWSWHICSAQDILWSYLYKQKTEHRLYGVIKTGTTVAYSVDMWLRNGKAIGVSVKNPKEANEILDFFEQKYPHIILGYSEELQKLRRENFGELIRLSDEKGRSYQERQDYLADGYNTSVQDEWVNEEPTLKFPMDT